MVKLAQIGDPAPCRGHIEWSTDLLELGPDPKRRRRRPLSNTSKNAPFQCRMRELWPKQWWCVCWIRGWHGSWVGDELQLREDHNVGVSSVTMSSSIRLGLSSNSRLFVGSFGPVRMFPILGAENSSKVFSAIASLLVLILLGWVDLWLKIDESQPNLYYPV
jgi:hypothetical protein